MPQIQLQLSKEFLRQWLIQNGFQGLAGQEVPEMTDDIVIEISNRYISLYESITGLQFVKADNTNMKYRVENAVNNFLTELPIA